MAGDSITADHDRDDNENREIHEAHNHCRVK
jgi:hypothetical protein